MQLARGRRLVEILKQPQYSPVKVEEQIAIIFAATSGYTDVIHESDVKRYEREVVEFLRQKHSFILKNIAEQKAISPETKTQLVAALGEFKAVFQSNK
jgi:F-type H+-transporting ATPase subunit alpha